MMQMLHTVYDLQESMEQEHFSMYLKQARIWVADNRNTTGNPDPELEDFLNDWLRMLKYVPNCVNAEDPFTRVPAPILTRWW